MSKFKEYLLEDFISSEKRSLISGPFGSNISKKFFQANGVPVIRGNNLSTGFIKFIDDGFAFVTEEKAKSLNTYATIDDLVFTAVGTLGQVGLIHEDLKYEKYIISNKQLRVRLNKDKLDPIYAFYWFSSSWMVQTIKKRNVGSTVPLINLTITRSLPVRIPRNLTTQKQIAKVLSDLDAKIEVNNKINQELEAMAKMLYDYWFVQFDFPDKNNKPYKSSGGKMVYNKVLKREIPEGWNLEKVSSCCQIIDCLHSKKSDYVYEEEGYYLLQLNNIKQDNQLDISKKYYVSKDEYKRWTTRIEVQDGDLVITNAGRVAGLAQIPKNVKAGIGRNITAIRPKKIKPTFLYYTFQGAEMERQIKLNTDSGSFFKSLNVRGIKELLLVRSPKYLEDKFENISLNHRRKRELNSLQNQKLAELRDWLLPMLMNGQITVGEAERELGMVAEEAAVYKKEKTAIEELFEPINYDYEVATVVLLTSQVLNKNFGKKYVHKMFSNIQLLEALPVFEDLRFQENGWGMHCPVLEKTIKNQKYFYFDEVVKDRNVLNFNYKDIKAVSKWMEQDEYSRNFVLKVKQMLAIYQKSLINKDMDRIELLNTVMQCMHVLETENFDAIWHKMEHWEMFEDGYKTKAEKFKVDETRLMIALIKDLKPQK